MSEQVVDLFAGLGGWDVAASTMGMDVLGIELDADACATREAAGLRTLRADITTLDPLDFAPVTGLIASPPCQSFSRAGKRKGLADDRGQLVWEVWRWADALRPQWIACEQVPDVLPIWRVIRDRLTCIGYSAWAGLLHAEQYGVPQTRTRAILMARCDGIPVQPPAPTHQRYSGPRQVPTIDGGLALLETSPSDAPGEGLFGTAPLRPWVSMAQALGWGMTERPSVVLPATSGAGGSGARATVQREREISLAGRCLVGLPRRADSGERVVIGDEEYRARDLRATDEPAQTVTEKARSWQLHTGRDWHDGAGHPRASGGQWTLRMGNQERATERAVDEPAPTVAFGHTLNSVEWVTGRPATTLTADSRISPPGHHAAAVARSQFGAGTVKITAAEALVLQGFPAGYPVQGTKTAQFRQIGNAIPPPLAAAILKVLAGG